MARWSFRRKTKRAAIQATEGERGNIFLESLMYPAVTGDVIPGAANNYPTYQSQVLESYRKYNGMANFGCPQFRAVTDIRTSFIAGDGLSLGAEDPDTRAWLEAFVLKNRFMKAGFFDGVLGGELTGRMLLTLRPVPGEMPKIVRIPYATSEPWSVVLDDKWDPESISDIKIKRGGITQSIGLQNFVYFRLGGDDVDVNKTTTRVGIVLGEFENYDRALKDMRLNNHVAARITPDLQTESDEETTKAIEEFKNRRFKIGKMRIGTGKFDFKTPSTGAADNLKAEMATAIKTISSITGVPVHWAGWADLMNNRATADSLYETMNNATTRERTIYADGIKDTIIKAQEIYINTGGMMISRVDPEVSVTIPVIDRSKFLDVVRGLSLAFSDGAISMENYRGGIPGIDPMETKRQVEAEAEDNPILIKTEIKPDDSGVEDMNDDQERTTD